MVTYPIFINISYKQQPTTVPEYNIRTIILIKNTSYITFPEISLMKGIQHKIMHNFHRHLNYVRGELRIQL